MSDSTEKVFIVVAGIAIIALISIISVAMFKSDEAKKEIGIECIKAGGSWDGFKCEAK